MILGCIKQKSLLEKWHDTPEKRYKIINTILKKYDLIGLTETNLKKLLGEPDYEYKNDNIVTYNCGFDFLNPVNLGVEFEKGIVIKTWIYNDFVRRKFTKEEWINGKYERFEIVDNLLSNKKLIGLKKEELLQLLGKPDIRGENFIKYNLGIGYSSNLVDPDWLIFYFKDDIVQKYQIENY